MLGLVVLIAALLFSGTSLPRVANAADGAMQVPVSGTVTSLVGSGCPGSRPSHAGIDIAAPIGTPVYAAYDGTVSLLTNPGGYGTYLVLTHINGYSTLYGHLNNYTVGNGAQVAKGQQIANSGNTGGSTGPHLHFEVRINGKAQSGINNAFSCGARTSAGSPMNWSFPNLPTSPNTPAPPAGPVYYNSTPGLVRTEGTGLVFYRTNAIGDGPTGSAGTDYVTHYGYYTDTPVVGDWNGDGIATPGLIRAEASGLTWYLTNDYADGPSGSATTSYIVHYGTPGDQVLVGDWNGDGKDSPGLVRSNGSTLTWYATNSVYDGPSGFGGTDYVINYGASGDTAVVGDWNGDGKDSPGLVRIEGNSLTWYMTNAYTGNAVTDFVVHYGNAGDQPVVGDWNMDGRSSPGLARTEGNGLTWYATNAYGDPAVTDYVIHYGNAGDRAVSGNWDFN